MTGVNTYDEYGIPSATNMGRFGYTGQAWLPELGMSYYKARMYSPTLGRFMQTDPIGYGDGMNWYAYVGNDPVNFRDPSGLDACDDYPGGWVMFVDSNRNGQLDEGEQVLEIGACGVGGGVSGSGAGALQRGGLGGPGEGADGGGPSSGEPAQTEPSPQCKENSEQAQDGRSRLPGGVTDPRVWSDPAALRFFQLTYQDNAFDAKVASKLTAAAAIPLALLPPGRAAGRVATAATGFTFSEGFSQVQDYYEGLANDIQARLDELRAQGNGSCPG